MVTTISSTTFAQETAVVKSNQTDQTAISKELKSNLEGNDPDKEILMQPGNSAPLPDWIKNLPNNKNNSLFGASAESTDSFVNQLLRMSENSYYDNEAIGSWAGSWQLYKKYTNPDTSFTVYVYRQKYIEETDTGLYGYTFAFRGTADKLDYIENAAQVVGNIGGLQAQDAVNYVRNMIDSDRNLIHHVHFTGHSLGGYLASWVQSEMVDGYLPMGQSYTLTFNAPGLSPNIFPKGAPLTLSLPEIFFIIMD